MTVAAEVAAVSSNFVFNAHALPFVPLRHAFGTEQGSRVHSPVLDKGDEEESCVDSARDSREEKADPKNDFGEEAEEGGAKLTYLAKLAEQAECYDDMEVFAGLAKAPTRKQYKDASMSVQEESFR